MGRYLRFVGATSRFTVDPPDFHSGGSFDNPCIIAMWHGQQTLTFLARRPKQTISAVISRHRDGAIVHSALRVLDIGSIWTGGRGAQQGGNTFRKILDLLAKGEIIALTADIPKVARVVDRGILRIAQLSGRPIYPLVVVTTRRIDLRNWDRMSIPLPFGRGVIGIGPPIRVGRDIDATQLEAARRALEISLDRTALRAYALIGDTDPGAELAVKNR